VDVIAFQGDLIFGRQTLPTMLGIKKTKTLTFIIAVAAAALFSTFTLAEGEFIYLIFLLNLLYFAGVLWKVVSKNYFVALKYEVFVDFNLVLFIGFYFISQAL
jgi:4-hydroxybenzoate polyprenyltransferase